MKAKVAVLISVLWIGCFGCNQKMNFDLAASSENFGQSITYNNKVDIIWVLDNSASMDANQQRLVQQVPDLVNKLNSLKLDYRMFVITTDMGYGGDGGMFLGSPNYLTQSTPSLVTQLQARMSIGEDGDNLERGLQSLEAAINLDSNQVTPSLRSDAFLVVNVLSNEDDKSAKTKTSSPYANYYQNFLDIKKPAWSDGSRSWIFNFIGVLGSENGACTTFQNYSEAGLAFLELANASGGIKESICTSSLSSAILNIRARILEIITEYKLSKIPALETLVVRVNGVLVPQSPSNGWEYSAARNSIKFYGSAVPAADARIQVDFKPTTAN